LLTARRNLKSAPEYIQTFAETQASSRLSKEMKTDAAFPVDVKSKDAFGRSGIYVDDTSKEANMDIQSNSNEDTTGNQMDDCHNDDDKHV
jgi:hypothetical protein